MEYELLGAIGVIYWIHGYQTNAELSGARDELFYSPMEIWSSSQGVPQEPALQFSELHGLVEQLFSLPLVLDPIRTTYLCLDRATSEET